MTTVKTVKIAAALAGAALIVQVAHAARAQQPAVSDGIALQRAAAIYNFRTTAQRGAQRGEEIYYFKCWYCHNTFTVTLGTGAVALRGLFTRGTLLTTGQPATDADVAEKIRNGSRRMPAYRAALSDADMADLLAYLRSDSCCFEDDPPRNPRYVASTATPSSNGASRVQPRSLRGGAWGVVHSPDGMPLEGIGIQLISAKTNIRTTVYSDDSGRYEFPPLEAGSYTLRVTRPLEFKPYLRDAVTIRSADHLDDIVLTKLVQGASTLASYLPPTADIVPQLTGVEWMLNLPGTAQEKHMFTMSCGFGCHSYQQIFRGRYDTASWRLIVERMTRGGGSPLIRQQENPSTEAVGRSGLPYEQIVSEWLGRVRGPDATDPPIHPLPRPRGAATRVVITEYELPRTLLAPHDVHGDSRGNIWYTPHRAPYLGMLDPRSGTVTEYHVPDVPGVLAGTHRIWVDERDIVYASENWRQNLVRLDPKTNEFKVFHIEGAQPNAPGFSNFAYDPQGFLYETTRDNANVIKIDRDTGTIVRTYPITTGDAYDNIVSKDGRFWAGGLGLLDLRTGENWPMRTRTVVTSPARGGFDNEGNAWFGGRGGMILKYDTKTKKVTEYFPPIPYVTFYEVMPDKNGEIWAAALHSGRFLRFNPRTERWIDYMLPEPYSHDRRTWIDNSTTPVTVWYVDHNGYVVRLQPLE
ncbi:MAG TPA: carboxypeptidase regulatory-like domain-containing protein [Vicinamibacterales bacterium]